MHDMSSDTGLVQYNACIKVPFSMIIAGPSNCGKTTFVYNLLKNCDRVVDKKFDYVVWFYGQTPPNETPSVVEGNIKFINGIPSSFDEYIQPGLNGLIVFDDLMKECENNSMIGEFFTQRCHHEKLNVIYLSQNLFSDGKERKTLSKNATYLVVFNTPLDQTISHSLARKLMPKNIKTFHDIFTEATKTPHSYLFVDGHQRSPSNIRLRGNIFDVVQHVFIPNKKQ